MKVINRILVIGITPLIILIVSICFGRYPLGQGEILQLLAAPLVNSSGCDQTSYSVFWFIRFPRAILVFLSGAALAVSGTVLQGIFKNPLVSSDILGVSTGALR